MSDNPYQSPGTEGKSTSEMVGSLVVGLIKVFTVLGVIGILISLFLLPMFRRSSPSAARRIQCTNNLKQIGMALHNYHGEYNAFPPAYTVDANGKPLHSWRTLLLPYIDQKQLYEKIDLSKPWNDPVNKLASETTLDIYCCPASNHENQTTYLAIVGDHYGWRAGESRKLAEISDDHNFTIMIIDVPPEDQVPWMSPQDTNEQSVLNFRSGSKLSHSGGVNSLRVDGSVRFLPSKMDVTVFKAMLTIDGNDDKIVREAD